MEIVTVNSAERLREEDGAPTRAIMTKPMDMKVHSIESPAVLRLEEGKRAILASP
jgi:hypothetical protein